MRSTAIHDDIKEPADRMAECLGDLIALCELSPDFAAPRKDDDCYVTLEVAKLTLKAYREAKVEVHEDDGQVQ